MGTDRSAKLAQARSVTLYAGQWLDLINFRAHADAVVFSPSMSTYDDMLDPSATDSARLAAYRAMRHQVLRLADVERLEGEATYARLRPVDPYGLRWRTTSHGATLETIACLLSAAIEIFEADRAE